MRHAASIGFCALALFGIAATPAVTASAPTAAYTDDFTGKPRLIVLSDMGNEPDDQMSMVRLLVYANVIDIEGLVATTSTWQRTVVRTDTMRELIAAYGKVRPNLMLNATGWPSAESLLAITKSGQEGYGMAMVGPGKTSDGARQLIAAADRDDPRPLWVGLWGGANTLAQALVEVRATRSPAELDRFVAKLRVYAISDQDDAGAWIRAEFPNLFWIGQPSSQNSDDYLTATWTGISGDGYYRNADGADPSLVTNEWLDANIRSKGPLGAHYPKFLFIMEGDTPSFLGLIDNGLASWRNPSWGGWGGRYVFRQPAHEAHPIWTQGGDMFSRTTSQDEVTGIDGRTHLSDQATIWRWRRAYQNDFAARMDWTVQPFAKANHNPVAIVNGQGGTAPIVLDATVGQPVVLDASSSHDPDGQKLTYRWFHYREAGSGMGAELAAVALQSPDSSKATLTASATCRPKWLGPTKCPPAGVAHVILEVTDGGSPQLTSYRRIIVRIRE